MLVGSAVGVAVGLGVAVGSGVLVAVGVSVGMPRTLPVSTLPFLPGMSGPFAFHCHHDVACGGFGLITLLF